MVLSIELDLFGFESEKYIDIKKSIESNNERIIKKYSHSKVRIALVFYTEKSENIIEKQNKCGGLLKSFKIKKYIFDNFIHISHAKNPVAKFFFRASADNFLI